MHVHNQLSFVSCVAAYLGNISRKWSIFAYQWYLALIFLFAKEYNRLGTDWSCRAIIVNCSPSCFESLDILLFYCLYLIPSTVTDGRNPETFLSLSFKYTAIISLIIEVYDFPLFVSLSLPDIHIRERENVFRGRIVWAETELSEYHQSRKTGSLSRKWMSAKIWFRQHVDKEVGK